MGISHIEARAVRLPVGQPTMISTRLLNQRDFVIVMLGADGVDQTGLGYTYAGTAGGSVVREVVRELLAPVLLGADPRDLFGLWDRMYQETLLAGRRGAVLRAMSAVDIALWDLAAKRANVPLAVLLGGTGGPVPAYASGGYYRRQPGVTAAELVAREIAGNRALGFTDHKIKVGGLLPEEDAERVAAAAGAIAGSGRLALDANNAYRSVKEALRAVRLFERAAGAAGLWWIEEPLSPDDVAGHAALAERLETPVATGEIAQTRWDFRDLIERCGADILQPDAGVIGGVGEWLRVARTAESFDLPVAPHWHANLHAHLASATPNCIAVEHFALAKDIYNFERMVTPDTRTRVDAGRLLIGNRPGLGIELDGDVLERFGRPDERARLTVSG